MDKNDTQLSCETCGITFSSQAETIKHFKDIHGLEKTFPSEES